mmetsp:Transcript_4214/g.11879  ORF Transcript_4214/g.11879 Transcript_4214/m.11879 type:complete len:451 (+) Transcript_4214:289-1641(+)
MMSAGTVNLVSYLEELPPVKLAKIYGSHWTCQAVLRSLPPLAKQYVLRLLFINTGISENIVNSWAQSSARAKHDTAVDALQRLQVLRKQMDRSGNVLYSLHGSFQEKLQEALCARHSGIGSPPKSILGIAPSTADVAKYSTKQWETLLLFLLGDSSSLPSAPSYMDERKLGIAKLLRNAGLMGESNGSVTQAGFQFLLSDTYRQMWQVLREYINTAEASSGVELAPLIGFLLQLGFTTGPIAHRDLTPPEQRISADMAALGVLCPFQGPNGAVYLSPTGLASSICCSGSLAKAADGYIIVESNYKVYAYTDSQIRMKILGLFVRLEVILPNLVVGTINRESIISALNSGITASQVVTYLRQHASPHISDRVPVVPETVADQIQLWEREQNRLRHFEACLFENFKDTDIFNKTCKHARELGVWMWQDNGKRRLVTTQDGLDSMKQFIRANK